jgi:hypothetical protein
MLFTIAILLSIAHIIVVFLVLLFVRETLNPAETISSRMRRHSIYVICAVFFLSVLVIAYFGIQFSIYILNVIVVLIVYVSYCATAFVIGRINPKSLRVLSSVIFAIPLIVIPFMFASTLLVWYLDVSSNIKTQMENGFSCRTVLWGGNVFHAEFGYTITLYRTMSVIPLFEREVTHVTVQQLNPPPGSPLHSSCEEALSTYRR